MKKTIILTIITLTMFACSPKNAAKTAAGLGKDLVMKSFSEWVGATNSGDITKILDLTYPKLFDLQPREQIEQMYTQMSMMGIKNLVKDAKLSDLSEFITSDGMQFAKAKMSAVSVTEVPDPAMVDMLYGQMKTMYDEDKISKTDNGVEVSVVEDMYIIHDDATKKMYFLQAGAQMAPMLGQILPADVVKKLNQ